MDKRSAQDWDKGIKQIPGGRVYPDGRVVRYRQAAILANVKNPREAYTRGAPVDLARLETVVDSRYLSLIERERIHDLRSRGDSMRAIGRALGRSASTISREIARNTATTVGYLPYAAQRSAAQRTASRHHAGQGAMPANSSLLAICARTSKASCVNDGRQSRSATGS